MTKEEKKKIRIRKRIEILEGEIKIALGKKTHNSAEINVAEYMRKIDELRKQL